MKWREAFLAALLAVPLIVILAVGFGRDPHRVPSVLEGQPAPEFTLPTLNGESLTLSALRGTPVVLNFWSTWCEPCKAEHQLLQEAAGYFGARAHFVGIVYQDSSEAARDYLQNRCNVYPQALDADSKTAIAYDVAGIPESFFIDAQGVIIKKHVGVLSANLLRQMLEAKP